MTGYQDSCFNNAHQGGKPCYGKIQGVFGFRFHSHCQYRQVSNIRRTIVGNQIVDCSDVVGASPVGAAPTTSSFST